MKLKRTKLAAIAMSALMAVSAFSPYVYAEESSETATEAATEAVTEATTEEVAEEAVEEAAVASLEEETEADAPAVTATTDTEFTFALKIDYDTTTNEDGDDVVTGFKATISAISTSLEVVDTQTFTGSGTTKSSDGLITYTVAFTAPTCKAAGSIKITAAYTSHDANGTKTYEYVSGSAKASTSTVYAFTDNGIDNDDLSILLSHTEEKDMDTYRYVYYDATTGTVTALSKSEEAALTCSSVVYVQYKLYCSECTADLGWGEPQLQTAVGHVYSDQTTRTAVVFGANSNIAHSSSGSSATVTIVDEEGYEVGEESVVVYNVSGTPTLEDAQ